MQTPDETPLDKRLTPFASARALLLLLSLATLLTPLLAGCLSISPLPTATPTPPPATDTPTFVIPTLIPTNTWTPPIPPSPTRGIAVDLGDIIFADDFEEDLGWILDEDIFGATALGSGRLTLATRRPGAWRSVLSPVPTLTDFYVEFNLRADICSRGDEYGLIFRVNSLSGHYQFGMRCEGGVRLLRILGNAAYTMITADQADIVVPGPPEESTVAVWASGSQFRFFINQVEVFSARDGTYPIGSIGFYVFSGESGQASVSFDDFIIRSLTVSPTETPSPSTTEESNGS
jgi:hypothetical protein